MLSSKPRGDRFVLHVGNIGVAELAPDDERLDRLDSAQQRQKFGQTRAVIVVVDLDAAERRPSQEDSTGQVAVEWM